MAVSALAVLMTSMALSHPAFARTQSDIPAPETSASGTPTSRTPASETSVSETSVSEDPAAQAPLPSPQEDVFTVGDIKIEGLQRISEGTVLNSLPVNIGDKLDQRRLQEALKAVYATGFFRDVELRRDANTLIVAVAERPSIESFEIKGNKDIKTEDMQKNLRNAGLAAGKTFDRSVLDDVTQYLTDMYFSRGKYGVKVDTQVEEVPGNKVKITINIQEGKRARIQQINIVGNTRFKEKEIREKFELKTPNWLSWIKQGDRYSREALQGDLEKLRSYYMDRGYANFRIDSTQVTIAPDKENIFITLNIEEGEVYKVRDVKLTGTMVVPEAELQKLLVVQPGQTFSNKLITASQDALSYRLGVDGYAFAKIDPVPTLDDKTREVSLTFFIDPGSRIYVRHINFLGAKSINDETLRREMRQLEGGYLSNKALERSKERIQARLPFVKKVDTSTTPVPGSADLVDVDVTVEEGQPGQFGVGIGYAQSQGIILNANVAHSNFAGRGERVSVDLNSGKYQKVYGFSHTNPYATVDGIARTFGLSYRDVTQFTSASSDFSTKTLSANLTYAYPITEFQTLQLGAALQSADLIVSNEGSARQAVDWVRNNGNPYQRTGQSITYDPFTGQYIPFGSFNFYGSRFKTADLVLGWNYDNRNRALFATRGIRHSVSLSYTLPGSEIEYWTGNYEYRQYVPLWRRFVLALNGEVGYSAALGDTTAPPPYRNFFGGGPGAVRGFKESYLGPRDNFGRPYGGNLKTVGSIELLFPLPEKFQSSARVGMFYDIGGIFYQGDKVQFFDKVGFPIDYSFKTQNLRTSIGIGVQWLSPMGLFQFSYALPQRYRKETELNYGDDREGFQFTIGQAF